MIANLLNFIAGTGLNAANPLMLIYLGLAAVHALAAYYHFKLADGRRLALCCGLASTLYLLLAILHGVATAPSVAPIPNFRLMGISHVR